MSLALAITDMVEAAETVAGLAVFLERQEATRHDYSLTITQGAHVRESMFGASRVTQNLDLILAIKKPNPATTAGIISDIEAALVLDRRRGGNAQTTTNPTEWTPDIDEGREGQTLTSTIGVVVYES